MQTIIVGSGPVADALTRRLTESDHQVSRVVDEVHIAEDLASRFPRALVVLGSGSDERALRAARAAEADVLFAVDEDDSHNMVACLLAKQQFSIEHVVALAAQCEDKPAFSALDILNVCAPEVVVSALVGGMKNG
jgi:trk system potassium uptake protein TrkA